MYNIISRYRNIQEVLNSQATEACHSWRLCFSWCIKYNDPCWTYSICFCMFWGRLLPLYFPRDKHEEEVALSKLPADVGDENGETIIDERKIRIKSLPKKNVPKPPQVLNDTPVSDVRLTRRLVEWFMQYNNPFQKILHSW